MTNSSRGIPRAAMLAALPVTALGMTLAMGAAGIPDRPRSNPPKPAARCNPKKAAQQRQRRARKQQRTQP